MSDDEPCFEFGNLWNSKFKEGDRYIVKTEETFYGTREELALVMTIDQENLRALDEYVSEGGIVDRHLPNGASLLQVAIELGKKNSLRALLDKGADPNRKGIRLYRMMGEDLWPRSYSPIESAAIFNRPEFIRILLRYGGNPHTINAEGENALSLATCCGAKKSVRFLRSLPVPRPPPTASQKRVMCAVLYANEKELLSILKERIDLDFIQDDGLSPVFVAVENGFYNCLQILLENGANSNIICKRAYPCRGVPDSHLPKKWTALECAVIHGYHGIMELLISYGANVYYENEEGRNALTVALLYNRPAAADLLQRRAPELMDRTVAGRIYKDMMMKKENPKKSLTTEEPKPSTSVVDECESYDWEMYERWVDGQTLYKKLTSSPLHSASEFNDHKNSGASADGQSLYKKLSSSPVHSARELNDHKNSGASADGQTLYKKLSSSPVHSASELNDHKNSGASADGQTLYKKLSSSPVHSASEFNDHKNSEASADGQTLYKKLSSSPVHSASELNDHKNSEASADGQTLYKKLSSSPVHSASEFNDHKNSEASADGQTLYKKLSSSPVHSASELNDHKNSEASAEAGSEIQDIVFEFTAFDDDREIDPLVYEYGCGRGRIHKKFGIYY